ncbi:MAG TPA: methyltransferase [Actinophytocola sp.]|uniref:methyltransferase n=1 Tax=Actinophytocola sp. TaxID=1872138 RepID=UPI002DDD3880|nr:methyltransferase [Actinophytocola sp.]HEV2783427.1 methyltransferase [Actinophytocola sp.]
MTDGPSLLDTVLGLAPAQIIHVAARLGLADHLAGGPKTGAELATATGSHGPSLHRLLRALVCLGVVTQADGDRFALAPRGMPLRSDAPDSIRSLVLLYCSERGWRSWGALEYGIRTGKVPAEHVTGMPAFEYFAAHPELGAEFNAAMAEFTRSIAPAVIGGYDFARFGTLVDVGGGNGTLLAAILSAVPSLRGVLFDLPHGVEHAAATLAKAGVAGRCEVVTGDFFDSVPPGADAYLLKSIVHDWDDERSAVILRNCRTAMADGGVVLVLERMLPDRLSPANTGAVLSDLNMLVFTGGRERTEAQYRALYAAAGLELAEVAGPFGDYFVIVGTRSSTE